MNLLSRFLPILLMSVVTSCSFREVQSEDEALYERGMSLYTEGRESSEYSIASEAFNEAIDCFLQVTQFEWSDRIDDSHFRAGKCFSKRAEWNDSLIDTIALDLAILQFNAVPMSSDHGLDAIIEKAECFYTKGKMGDSLSLNYYDSAYSILQSIADNWPSNTQMANILLIQGHVNRKANLFYETVTSSDSAAVACYEAIIESYPESEAYDNALYWAGKMYWAYKAYSGYRERAVAYFTLYVELKAARGETSDPKYSKALAIVESEKQL